MRPNILSSEGPVIGFLDKIGHLIVLNVLWLIGCLPLVTIGTSSTALYYAVVKSIRHGQGQPVREFWKSYRANLKRGILSTLVAVVLGGLLALNLVILTNPELGGNKHLLIGSALLLALLVCMLMYIWPILSRFTMKVWNAWKLAFVMSLRFFHYTLILVIGTAALVILQIWILPFPTVFVVPALWCYVTTYLIEKALRRYMPEKQESDNAWYYEK